VAHVVEMAGLPLVPRTGVLQPQGRRQPAPPRRQVEAIGEADGAAEELRLRTADARARVELVAL